jgi:replicative DNA helicase
MISSLGRINQSNLRTGRLSDEDWPRIDSAMNQLSQAPIFIDETPALTPTELRARARRLKREHRLGLVVPRRIAPPRSPRSRARSRHSRAS